MTNTPHDHPEPDPRHNWETDKDGHIWGRWLSKSRTEEYRNCIHPQCNDVQVRKVSNA